MCFFGPLFSGNSLTTASFFVVHRSLRGRMLILCLPLLAVALFVIFFSSWRVLESVASRAISRNAQFRSYVMGQALTQILAETRNNLLLLASGELDQESMVRRLKYRSWFEKAQYREVAFIGLAPENKYLFLNCGGEIVVVPPEAAMSAVYGPFHSIGANHLPHLPGRVNTSAPVEVSYTLLPVNKSLQSVTLHVLRFSTAVHDAQGRFQGVLILSLDLSALRAVLSIYSSGYVHGDGDADSSSVRSLFFDKDGWMLFQSEGTTTEDQGKPLSSDAVRGGFRGDFGRPGFSLAFRPGPEYMSYWTMVLDVQNGSSGRLAMTESGNLWGDGQQRLDGMCYVPVTVSAEGEGSKSVIGGIAVLDASFILSRTGTQMLVLYICCFLAGMALFGGCLWRIAGNVNRQLHVLAIDMEWRNEQDSLEPIYMPPLPRELEKIKNAANRLLERLRWAIEHNIYRQVEAAAKLQREPADDLPDPEDVPSHGLVGNSPLMRHLQQQIRKVAPSGADVLVVGDTGTGKELVSEYIHRLSPRMHGPFISINCGALDETLLMDTLFGHVKGAFTEAKAARKGAFLAADGGTLMLDEVGNAAPKVQQALLRALSTRCIRPLGADYDMPFNTRIIAATNAEIGDEAMKGTFREDLYYRLAVITIHTPSLWQRKEDIPMLLVHFLSGTVYHGEPGMPKIMPVVSRGALTKLMEYNWPGNVRELKNCVTNALTFCEGGIIFAENISIGAELAEARNYPQSGSHDAVKSLLPARPDPSKGKTANAKPTGRKILVDADLWRELNPRQRRILPQILAKNSVSRNEYQSMVREEISARTALYDLQSFVALGILIREGRGPALRYLVARREAAGQTVVSRPAAA